MTQYRSEIIICPTCKGEGYTVYHETTCYHKGEYDVIKSDCPKCEGFGRLRMKETKTFELLSRGITDY